MGYYDWNNAISYDADVTMVITRRGLGKTYGIRAQCIRDWIRHRWRFVQIVRYRNSIAPIASDYFGKVGREFPGYVFKTEGAKGYIAEDPGEGKPRWQLLCYFVALSQMQQSKESTYTDVCRLIYDEAILDRMNQFTRYLRNEWDLLYNVVDSCTRQNAGDGTRPHLYLLANACDLINPVFSHYGITEVPPYGFTWHGGKQMLLHYVEPGDDSREKSEGTLAGRMARGTASASVASANRFTVPGEGYIEPKPPEARFRYALRSRGDELGVWYSPREALYYVTDQVPSGEGERQDPRIYTLTADDGRVNYIQLRSNDRLLRNLSELHYLGCLRYSTPAVRESFLAMGKVFGIK